MTNKITTTPETLLQGYYIECKNETEARLFQDFVNDFDWGECDDEESNFSVTCLYAHPEARMVEFFAKEACVAFGAKSLTIAEGCELLGIKQ